MTEPSFAMLCCAHGAEAVVKQEVSRQGWRLAFSRPGFVTVKHDNTAPAPGGIFIRTASRSLGNVRGDHAPPMIQEVLQRLSRDDVAKPFDRLHVWPKDRLPIGKFGFEPGIDEVSRAVGELLQDSLAGDYLRCESPNQIAEAGDTVLDVVLVEPSHWFIGAHQARDWPSRWPGGVQPIQPRQEPVSRAYYKAAEAIQWSGFDVQPRDVAVEVGSAPGGASQRLLELGLEVIGIDPAEMDPRVAEHDHFRHLRARAGDLPRKEFRGAKWLLVDSNVKPDKTLVTVRNIVTHRQSTIEGLLITLKLGNYGSADKIDRWTAAIRAWNPRRIDVRQLARNRCEVCYAVRM